MRKRRCAFHADSQEDYFKIAHENQDKLNIFYGNYKTDGLTDEMNKSPSPKSNKMGTDWGTRPRAKSQPMPDFNFSCNEERVATPKEEIIIEGDEEQYRKNSPATLSFNAPSDSAVEWEIAAQKSTPQKRINCMLIGAPNVGKHDLINSFFPADKGSDSDVLISKRRLDLVLRQRELPEFTLSYKFWFKELINDDSYESLIKLYYKQCAIFIFTYDLTSMKSFEILCAEIDKIQEDLQKQTFQAFLVAINSDKEAQREVRYEEGVALKLKYNMQHFTETNVLIEKETQQLLTRIESV